jgi:hypothetical protein
LQDRLQRRIDMIVETAGELSKLRASPSHADADNTLQPRDRPETA